MVTIKGVEMTPEQVHRGMQCDTPEELIAACKEIGIDVTAEEAENFLENMEDIDLTSEQMKTVAGGRGDTKRRTKKGESSGGSSGC
ncbi:MAG: hypothetical protein IKZ66_01175 [Schwartzia sp.]|nr:hypothetical protein [Schwartzia sp. (in: firmicutes)]